VQSGSRLLKYYTPTGLWWPEVPESGGGGRRQPREVIEMREVGLESLTLRYDSNTNTTRVWAISELPLLADGKRPKTNFFSNCKLHTQIQAKHWVSWDVMNKKIPSWFCAYKLSAAFGAKPPANNGQALCGSQRPGLGGDNAHSNKHVGLQHGFRPSRSESAQSCWILHPTHPWMSVEQRRGGWMGLCTAFAPRGTRKFPLWSCAENSC
jgi:hypothetical protein